MVVVDRMEASSIEQRPMRRSVLGTLRHNFHWKCFFLTLMIDACVAVTIWCQLSYFVGPVSTPHQSSMKGPCDQGYSFIPIAFGIMLYVVYLMECWHCKTRMDLCNKVDISDVYEATKKCRAALPVVWWRAVCYHYVRRTRQVTRYRNGDAVTTTQVYYERMNSHTASSVFLYHDCGVKDISKNLVDLEKFPVTKVRFSKGFVFTNIQAANEFEEQRARFFQENEQRDDYMEVREGLDLINEPFKEYMVAFASPKRLPFYTSQFAFWTLSILLMSWFIRVLVEFKTAYVHYQVTKLFGTNYLSPTNQHYTGPLTGFDASENRDTDATAMQNYYIVPSYSEALLMDPVASSYTQVLQDNRRTMRLNSRHRVHQGGSQGTLCNEAVIPNYGAMAGESRPLVIENQRSRSMTFSRPGLENQPGEQRRGSAPRGALRSFSFGSLVGMGRGSGSNSYRVLPVTPEECLSAASEEPPPPYEIALQMCRPIYAKIKHSLSSLDKFRFHRSNTFDKNGLGPSSGHDTPL